MFKIEPLNGTLDFRLNTKGTVRYELKWFYINRKYMTQREIQNDVKMLFYLVGSLQKKNKFF